MAMVKQTAFRFTSGDLAVLDALQRKTGIGNRTDLLRWAIRAAADAHGVTVEGHKALRPRPTR
jgi:hypothetical protein